MKNARKEGLVINTLVRNVLNQYPFMTPRASLLKLLPEAPKHFGPFGICDGLKLVAYPDRSSDHVVRSLFWLGSFDLWVCQTLKRIARQGSTALDIGANIGLMSLMMAQSVGDHGRVHSFEPAPDTFDHLTRNVAANSLSAIKTHSVALSDHRGTCRLVVSGDPNGMAHIGEVSKGDRSFDVPMTTFDEWAQSQQLEAVSVCRIDVDGHEPQVLAGMQQSLSACMIECIVFEDHASPTKSATQQILQDHGYEILRMFKSLRRVTYQPVGSSGRGTPTAHYVAVRPESKSAEIIMTTT